MKPLKMWVATLALALCGSSAVFAQATKLVFEAGLQGAPPGQAFYGQPVISAQDAAGNVDYNFSGPVTVTIKAGDATGGAVLSGTTTVQASSGYAYFSDLGINTPGAFRLTATSGALAGDSASVIVPLSISEVWTQALPTGVDTSKTLDALNQIRSFAVNRAPGSEWAGTAYFTRRVIGAAGAIPAGPGDVFFWRGHATNPDATPGSGMLTAQGPDWLHPDGKFDRAAAIAAGWNVDADNSIWAIGVGGDNYVYTAGLTAGKLMRWDPDGKNPVLLSSSFTRIRQMYVTGSGAVSNNPDNPTTIWLFTDPAGAAEKWVAASLDNGKPSNFQKTTLFTPNDRANQVHQSVVNSKRDTLYYTFWTPAPYAPQPLKYNINGTRDESFPVWTQGLATGLSIDSEDRSLFVAWGNITTTPDYPIVALSPRNGANILDNGSGAGGGRYVPSTNWSYRFNDGYIELARYSDRHYFYLGSSAGIPTAANGGAAKAGTSVGVFRTNIPAPMPLNPKATDAGQGGKVNLSWTLPMDTEVTGVNIYRATTPTGFNFNAPTFANKQGGSLSDTGLVNGTTYYYIIRTVAKDVFTAETYESANITPMVVVPTSGQPVPPPVTNAMAEDTKAGGQVKLTWSDPAPAGTLDHVNVYRSTASGTLGTKLGEAPAGAQTYTDDTAVNGTAYYYTLKTANSSGGESAGVLAQPAPVTPTDQVAPTFAGVKTVTDYGYPGFHLTWSAATDRSTPITYKVYTAATPGGFNFGSPAVTTTDLSADLRGLTVGQDVYIVVRAVDAAGNPSANDKVVAATPARVIVDSDNAANVNFGNFNPQPDSSFPALVPVSIGPAKGSADDLISTGYHQGVYFLNTNDKKGKVQFTVPINATGKYDISAFWNPDAALNTPNYIYHITLPNGQQLPDIALDMVRTAANAGEPQANQWNLLTTQTLTPGNLIIVGDATQSPSTDPAATNVSGAVRARMVITPTDIPIYKAAAPPTIDGNINASEWGGAPVLTLGRAYQDVLPGKWTGPADYTGSVQLKWDADNLYVAAQVTDDVVSFPVTALNAISQRDGLEVYLGLEPTADKARTAYYIPGDYQVILSADKDEITGALSGVFYSPQASLAGAQVVVKATPQGYNIEAALPWYGFDGAVPPSQDQVLGFNLQGNDNDQTTPTQDSAFSLSGQPKSFQNPQAWTRATLKGAAPAVVRGDVNLDGTFDALDVAKALRIASGLETASGQQIAVGDVSGGDGKITLLDVARMQQALNGGPAL